VGYWILTLCLVAFGFLGALSIGRPFLLVGIALLLLAPLRKRPRLFWPPLAAVVAYNAAWWAVVPIQCTATQVIGEVGRTVCTSLLGSTQEGSGLFNPSYDPANQAAFAAACICGLAALAVTWRLGSRRPERR